MCEGEEGSVEQVRYRLVRWGGGAVFEREGGGRWTERTARKGSGKTCRGRAREEDR